MFHATPQRRWPFVAVIVSALLFAMLSPAPTAHAVEGTLLGAHVNRDDFSTQIDAVEAFESSLGRDADIVNRYHPFDNSVLREEAEHIAAGRLPMISWRATVSGTDPNRAAKIAAGNFNTEIDAMARAVDALNGRVLIRFNWEMDQSPGQRQYIGTQQEFIAAWKHIVQRFRNKGVDNAEFVWAPRGNAFNKGTAQAYYPGDNWVDWIGGSAVPINSYRSFDDIFHGFIEWGTARNKPLLVWIGVREQPGNSSYKPNFIEGMSDTLKNAPSVDAVVWYEARSPKGNDYHFDTTTATKRAYTSMACDPWFDTTDACDDGGGGGGGSNAPEIVELSTSGNSSATRWFPVEVPVTTSGDMDINLSWDNPNVDMYLFVRRPGQLSNFANSRTNTASPKSMTFNVTQSGTYTVIAMVKAGGSTAFDLTVTPPG